ncbi:MAG TPA: AAA family ATPase [Candidatus Coprocola pullicola]|nr:AAA family ATPase [Candidatus Coprocola pullicola]
MNIKQAKEEIKNTIQAYLQKDSYGNYKIPTVHQRPVLLIGAPGIGKTAIMEQIARECNIGIVSYTITHHTRQSAIGLPFIQKKIYAGKEYSVTEYTMSEIIASVYEKIEMTGLSEGILFIDEINCVSETLAPAMLQFLQNKTFGTHQVPEGWIIVAAGNPPEYNKSVREFDIVTLDRVKKIEVKEDFTIWKEYAYKESVHSAILSYLEIKKEHFYTIETTVDGKYFVTARGWEDLSRMMVVYEELDISIDEGVIYQYVQHRAIAKDFANYLDLYYKYKNDYHVHEILQGHISKNALEKLSSSSFDEKLSVIGLLLSRLGESFKKVYSMNLFVTTLHGILMQIKPLLLSEQTPAYEIITKTIQEQTKRLEHQKIANLLEPLEIQSRSKVLETLEQYQKNIKENNIKNGIAAFEAIKQNFSLSVTQRKEEIDKTAQYLNNAFVFLEKAFGENQELVIFITELTSNPYSVQFINENGSEKYYHYNKSLLFQERHKDILQQIHSISGILNTLQLD